MCIVGHLWLCAMFSNQDPCRWKNMPSGGRRGTRARSHTGPAANILQGKASHVVDPAISGVGQYNLSHKEAVIIFEQ